MRRPSFAEIAVTELCCFLGIHLSWTPIIGGCWYCRYCGHEKPTKEYTICDLGDDNLRIINPIAVNVCREASDDDRIVFSVIPNEFPLYGCGDSFDEALCDIKSMMCEYYMDLTENEGSLGARLKRELEIVRRYIGEGNE